MKFKYIKEEELLIVQEASRQEYNQVKNWLTRFVKGYRFMPAFKAHHWNGKQSYFNEGKINLGLWKELMNACNAMGTPFIVENKPDLPFNREITYESVYDFCIEFFKHHKRKDKDEWVQFMPYEHQIQTAYQILRNRFCMAEVATSGGKTLIISIVIFYTLRHINPDAKFMIIVPSITLVTQFYDEIMLRNFGENFGILKDENLNDYNPCDVRIEEVMSDRPRTYNGGIEPNIFIGTYQSLEKRDKEFFSQFHTVITDEAHQGNAKTIQTILKSTFGKAYCRFGVSGTFPPDDSCEILSLQSLLGPKVSVVSADELRKKGIITPMKIKAFILNHDNAMYQERLKEIRKSGNGKDAFLIEKEFIQNSDKRLELIKFIIEKCDNNTLLLFHTIDYGKKLLDYLSKHVPDKDFYYIDGEVSGKKREEIKQIMEITGDRPKVLIASFGTLSTGVSIKAIFYILFADSFKSEQIIIQSIGRGLRLHGDKDKLIVFDLVDVFAQDDFSNILYSHFKQRLEFYDNRKYPYDIIKRNL